MKNLIARCASLLLIALLGACGGSSNKGNAPPPTNVVTSSGDGWIRVNWDATAGLDYWVFTATDPTLTTLNWLNVAGGAAYVNVKPPFILCSASNGRERWFTVNARSSNDPGGAGSPLVSSTPRAAGSVWSGGTALGADVSAVGFAGLTTCSRTALSTVVLTAVGPGAAIFSSADNGATWTQRTAPTGFNTDLNAVASITARPNDTANPGVRTIAVGAGGAALVSNDSSVTWSVSVAFNAASAALRGIVANAALFVAVGDSGTVRSTNDGVTWNTLNANTTVNLRTVAFGASRYVAVGEGGAIVSSTNVTQSWTTQVLSGVGTLRAIAYGNNYNDAANTGSLLINTFVAVGDGGQAAVSSDGGATWSAVTVPGAGDLTGIAYTSRFVAVDAAGNAFTSATGLTWSGPIATGSSGLRSVTTAGFGFVAVGDGGAVTSSF